MNISKFDLYKSEWLELVFDDRNKEYGAYDLRKHYADNMLKAMGITFGTLLALGMTYAVLHTAPHQLPTIIHDPQTIITVTLRPPAEPPRPIQHSVHPPAVHSSTIIYTTPVVAPDPVTTNPPTREQLTQVTIGPETVKGNGKGDNILKTDQGSGSGTTLAPAANIDPVDVSGLDVMPEPYGGAAAWAKFLQKNIHYPHQASEEGKQGRVWLSFIIEKDGHLSNIVVERGVGFGLDEEALRVLKLAPAWKPGKQNGAAVRVKYNIPVNFQIADND